MADILNRFKNFIGMGSVEEYYDEESNDTTVDSLGYTSGNNTTKNSGREHIFGNSLESKEEDLQLRRSATKIERGDDKLVSSLASTGGLRVVLSKPTVFDNCQTICSHLRAQMTVVLNLEYVANSNDRKRIFDFVSGCCFALDCNIQKVSEFIYIIAPYNVDVFSELDEATGGSDNEKANEAYSYRTAN